MNRREFVSSLASAPLALAAPASDAGPTLAAQAYIFSQAYARLKERMEEHLRDVLETIATAGFKTVELVNTFYTPENASTTTQALLLSRMKCPVVYNSGVMHTAEGGKKTLQDTLELAKRVKGLTPFTAICINCNPKPQKEPKTDAELAVEADNINRLARDLKKQGLRTFVHQHDAEMANDAREWRHILKNTDPKLVEFCLDIHWIYRGGQDVMTILKEATPRLASVHVRNSKNKIWTEDFGDGDVDYRAVAAHLKASNFKGLIVVELAWDKETEPTRSLEANLKRSREYAEQVFGIKA
jgi:inosose dehydratase